ncbi:MAG TPA: Dabb family protein [Gemmataceae bacterium]|jgi:hypothetical protein|nr:Dabb family protein [Gemmataceae bacterium]
MPEPLLAHNVFFTLNDNAPTRVAAMVAACKKYLTVQAGILYFACGRVEPELSRPVNVRDFDVGLHIVFVNRAAHDAYQTDAAHLQFITENKSNWKTVRVFDSLVEQCLPK